MKKLIPFLLLVSIITACEPVELTEYLAGTKPPATKAAVIETDRPKSETTAKLSETTTPKTKETAKPGDTPETETAPEPQTQPEPKAESLPPFEGKPEYNNPSVIESDSGICYNLTDGVLLYGKEIDERVYPSSATKLLTALVALEHVPSGFTFTVGDEIGMKDPEYASAGLQPGQELDTEGILAAMLLPSGNDAAYTIAINVSRHLLKEDRTNRELADYFIGLMNDYAKKLGAENSSFKNPDGFHESGHYSTLRDLLRISAAAAQNKTISGICSKASMTVNFVSGESKTWDNRVKLAQFADWDIKGLNVGHTDESGYSFVGHVAIKGKEYVTIVSGAAGSGIRDEDTVSLFNLCKNGGDFTAAYIA